MIGITSEFTKVIENCERYPEIKYIQILFCQRNIAIYYGYFRRHILREINYGKQLKAQYIVIHCGSKGGRKNIKRTISIEKFVERLKQLQEESSISILIENSASKKCFGSTFDELLGYVRQIPKISICYDTMHHY